MLIIKPDSSDIFEYPNVLSEKDSILIRITYRPPLWQPGLARVEGKSIVIPTTFNGFQYPCVSGGISGDNEPVWPMVSKGTVADGNGVGSDPATHVIWKAEPYSYLLGEGQNITASDWEGVNCTLLPDSFTTDYSEVQIDTITHGVSTISIFNTITFGTQNLKLKRGVIIPVMEVR